MNCLFTTRKVRETRRGRRGSIALESLLFLPLFVLVLLVGIELAIQLSVSQRLAAASAYGVRVAAQGGGEEEVEQAVRRALGGGTLQHAKVTSLLRDDAGDLLETGDTVEVIVEIPARDIGPSFLSLIGIRLTDEQIGSRSVMRKE
jgi:hypothetical protein